MEIAPRVHHVPGMRGANVYLLQDSALTLVDTGMPGGADTILSYVEGLGKTEGDVTRIVITHHHLDHVGSLAAVRERTGAEVIAHPGDALLISGEEPPPPATSSVVRLLIRLIAPFMPDAEPAAVDRLVVHGESLDMLGGARVIHVPGHTPGSIALHFPSERLLICGDAMNQRRGRLGPPIRLFTKDMSMAEASIRRMAELEFDVLCPGHGLPITSSANLRVRSMAERLER